ncbi:MAG: NAD-dependent epimerase/dehydratase family protein [Planctomycetota bacterium]
MRPSGKTSSANRLIFGCGYLGERVAKLWLERGDHVSAVTRSESRPLEWAERGLVGLWTIGADVTRPETLDGLTSNRGWWQGDEPAPDTVLVAVGYDRSAGPSIDEVYAQGFRNVLDRLPDETGRVIYISTTGVWSSAKGGNADGDWVDEQTTPSPTRPGGIASLAAEEALRASRFADRGVALRLAGIYGPGRVPMASKLASGEPIAAPSAGPLNLIHVDDAAAVVAAAADLAGDLPQVLCVSDGNPPLRLDYYHEIARLTGAPAPVFTQPPSDSPQAARAAASKQVRNDLMRQTLGIELTYPSYREGLAAILGDANLGNRGAGG